MKTKELAKKYARQTIEFRRELHRNPEPSMKEFNTTNRVCEELDKLGVWYKRFEPTGVMAEIKGTKAESDKRVAIRGDMDALEIAEKTDLDFASDNGLMHACGHDTHTSMLLGAVKVLNEMKDEFRGTVRFVFQPGEEAGEGALCLMEQGVMDDVDFAFGIHSSSMTPMGTMAVTAGPSHAAADRFWIKVKGKTAHGADPASGIDAAVAGSAIVMNLQTLVSREFDPSEPLVITVGQIHSGSRFNILPGYCEIEGTNRTYSREIHDKLPEVMTRIAQNTAAAFRCEAEVTVNQVAEVLVNDDEAYEIAKAACEKINPGKVIQSKPTMGFEDFAFYTRKTKAAFIALGAMVEDSDKVYPMHNEKVQFNEDALEIGVATYAQVAIDALEKLNK